MSDYDFSTLNDKEFENLSIDLISKDKNKRFERFKVGKDGGIDGRFYHDDGSQEVIQCKHYLKTGFNGLISSLKKKNDKSINEIEKVKKLNPVKYIFVTSLPLSAENKKTIKELFKPYIVTDNDIYGQEDLNVILKNNLDIEKRYYKLWLSSTVVLDKIFNNAIESRSKFLLEDIKEKSKYYVVTENHDKAIEKLEISHIIIIAGEPGIGKTTLAEQLALWYIEKDFRFYNIENPINEVENIYKEDEKQIFYFDDFLGANYLNAIEDKKDTHIVKFMNRIKKDKTKRFILTSRTNIFNQGLALSDTFKSKNIESEEFIIKIESLKDIDKAKILYNHIWHSDLNEDFINEIYIDKRYNELIKHKNFYPRLIEYITDIKKIEREEIDCKNYWNYIIEKLDNPQDIWKKAFERDSDEFSRIIVMLVVFNGNKIEEVKLKNAYNKYIKLSELQNNSHFSKEFDSIIEEIVKYFLKRNKICNKHIEYSLFNPSIADFVIKNYSNKFLQSCLALETFESLKELPYFYEKNKINYHDYIEVLTILFNKFQIENINKNADYFLLLVELLLTNKQILNIEKIEINLEKIINEKTKINLIRNFIDLIIKFNINFYKVSEIFKYLFTLLDNDIKEINLCIKLFNFYNIKDEEIIFNLNEFIEDSLISILQSRLEDLEVEEIPEEDMIYQYDEEGQIIGLFDFNLNINDFLEEYIYEVDDYYGKIISVKDIIYNIDVQTVKDFFIQTFSLKNGFSIRIRPSYTDKFKEIDDLFEK
jgi:adenylate kinase family enzyme